MVGTRWLAIPAMAMVLCGSAFADTGDPSLDDDGDGWTIGDGDCDDGDPAVNPDATEICGNAIDDDCDGLADADVCDSRIMEGTLQGGNTCTGNQGWALLLVPPIFLVRRWRS